MPSPKVKISAKHKLHREYKANIKRAEQKWNKNANIRKINGQNYTKFKEYPSKPEAEKESEVQKAEGCFTSVERSPEGWTLYILNPTEEKGIIGLIKKII